MNTHGYFFCFLDILGFKAKLETLGLEELDRRHLRLMSAVKVVNERFNQFFPDVRSEAPIWLNGEEKPDLRFLYKVYTKHASDSIWMWSDRTWEIYKHVNHDSPLHFASSWSQYPKPCDSFLDVCNEMICRGIEEGLPLRGGISMGEGIFDNATDRQLGRPINEAAQIEGSHDIVGVTMSKSFIDQIIPKRFCLEFDDHIKKDLSEDKKDIISSYVLDWPRHWRNTRSGKDVFDYLKEEDFCKEGDKFEKTAKFIEISNSYMDMYESHEDTNAFVVYKDYFKINQGFLLRLIKDS